MLRIILSAFLVLIYNLPATPWMDPRLNETGLFEANGTQTVIVQFKSSRMSTFAGMNREEIQRAKMLNMQESQSGFRRDLGSFAPSLANEPTSLWINNSMILDADADMIDFLSKREDVERVVLDEEILLDQPLNVEEDVKADGQKLTYGLKKVRANEVWSEFKVTGKGVTVGILDTGYASHPDLDGRVKIVKDFAGSVPEGQPNDGHGHGTHCMGTIGGRDTSGQAIGVAPDVDFIVAKIFTDAGRTTDAKIQKAMQWIADPDGNPATNDQPRVVSNSWGGPKQSYDASKPRWDAVQTWRDLDMVPVFAAGNSGSGKSTVGSPGAFPHSFTIGATDIVDKIAGFSSRGPVKWEGKEYIKPEVSAPGVDVYSASHKDGKYAKMSGTSMATPHVAGVVALLIQANPGASVDDVETVLEQTAVDLGDEGQDNNYGYGRVDAYEAVKKFMKTGTLELTIDSEYPATVKVEALNILKTDIQQTPTLMALPEGAYTVEISAFGHVSKSELVNIVSKETTTLSVKLQPTARHMLTARVSDTNGKALQATVAFLDAPIEVSYAVGGDFQKSLPVGSYEVVFSFRGYKADRGILNLDKDTVLDVVLTRAPGTLVVQGDSDGSLSTFYTAALNSLSKDFELNAQVSNLSSYDLLAYETVVWYTGNRTDLVLSESQQKALDEYIKNGGSVILTGKGIGNALDGTRFYADTLGAIFKGDRKWWKTISGMDLKFGLDDDGSAKNQDTPDAIGLMDKGATTLFEYKFGSAAGIARSHGHGKVVYLGFGVEGIGDLQTRSAVLKIAYDAVKPSLSAKLGRLEAAFNGDRNLHRILADQITIQPDEAAEFEAFIRIQANKVPFQSQIFQLQNLK